MEQDPGRRRGFAPGASLGTEAPVAAPVTSVEAVLYLLSDLSGFVSGQRIVVDGGHIM